MAKEAIKKSRGRGAKEILRNNNDGKFLQITKPQD